MPFDSFIDKAGYLYAAIHLPKDHRPTPSLYFSYKKQNCI